MSLMEAFLDFKIPQEKVIELVVKEADSDSNTIGCDPEKNNPSPAVNWLREKFRQIEVREVKGMGRFADGHLLL